MARDNAKNTLLLVTGLSSKSSQKVDIHDRSSWSQPIIGLAMPMFFFFYVLLACRYTNFTIMRTNACYFIWKKAIMDVSVIGKKNHHKMKASIQRFDLQVTFFITLASSCEQSLLVIMLSSPKDGMTKHFSLPSSYLNAFFHRNVLIIFKLFQLLHIILFDSGIAIPSAKG